MYGTVRTLRPLKTLVRAKPVPQPRTNVLVAPGNKVLRMSPVVKANASTVGMQNTLITALKWGAIIAIAWYLIDMLRRRTRAHSVIDHTPNFPAK